MLYSKGFTLLEISLYVLIGGATLAIASFSYIQINNLNTSLKVRSEVNSAGDSILSQISNIVQSAETITTPQSGQESSSLSLLVAGTTQTVSQNNNTLEYIQTPPNPSLLNPASIRVSNTSFRLINNTNQVENETKAQSLGVKFTLSYSQPNFTSTSLEYAYSRNFEAIISLPETNILESQIPLLTSYPGPAIAYSLRRLSGHGNYSLTNGYNGPAIRVRRESDNLEQDIGFTEQGNLDIQSLLSFANNSNTFVTTWYDQSPIKYQNLLVQSEALELSNWTKLNASITQNTINAPDASLTADRLIQNTSNGEHYIQQNYTTARAGLYTFSTYVKKLNAPSFTIQVFNGSLFPTATFNLDTGQVSSTANGVTEANIIPLADNWYRVYLATNLPAATNITPRIFAGDTGSYIGDGITGFQVWGAQLTEGALTNYQITTTSAILTAQAYNAVQTTQAAQPKIVDSVTGLSLINNLPALRFDGVNDELVVNNSVRYTSGFVVGSRSAASQSFLHHNASADRGFSLLNFGSAFDIFDTQFLNRSTTPAVANSDPKNSLNIYVGRQPVNSSRIGSIAIAKGTPGFTYLNGTISEFIIWTSDQSANQAGIVANMSQYYSTP